ncbi:probable methyltransferase PMT28 isoform X2 [Elaeis guineensis]|uniref:Methyltransferase n=1 Tax=Elaeis guineensis var. tenera TaxID=51953 RepID=A0A6I9SNR6_ELAGV|nr:probable methyltransferase PMT28 isoform X2 [Elaeis guineensis]
MAGVRLGRSTKRVPLVLCAKVTLVVLLAIGFIVIRYTFSSSSSAEVSSQRSSFDDIFDPESSPVAKEEEEVEENKKRNPSSPPKDGSENGSLEKEMKEGEIEEKAAAAAKNETRDAEGQQENEKQGGEEKAEVVEGEGGIDEDMEDGVDVNTEVEKVDEGRSGANGKEKNKKKKKLGPLFDPGARYNWKLCGGRHGHNYIPCVYMEGGRRHHERSCPQIPLMCLVSLPQEYKPPLPWPERESKIFYKDVAHPKLSAFIKTQSWLNLSEEFLLFPREESEYKGGAQRYINSIEEMAPDIEWGKNIRVVLDIGCTSASFGATLLKKNVITLSLGLMNDQIDLAQLVLERGIPAVVGDLGSRRLPFPSGVFDAIHCGKCNIPWQSSGGRLLFEMNRILRPGGYFIISTKHGDIDSEEGMSTLMASICWNILAHKTDEVSEVGVRIYQRPASNDIYELRRTKEPPFCKEDDKIDAAWYTPIKSCLHKVPSAIEQHGTDWPEEWPKRLETFPEWLGDSREKLTADHEHWKAIINKSYLNGIGIDWSHIRNIMDMKAIYGGFAAALSSQKVWVMNVVPVHSPNTLPIIYERGLLGIYHDWCEPFSTYPRSYDLLHADHLFSRLKNRCKQPVVVVVEMDRILRPGGWAIIRDKLEILNTLETILKSLHWEIRMTYAKDKEGIICAQKTTWRP